MVNKGSPFPFLPDLHTIFIDTDIDTHLAMAVSLYDTITDVKAKITAEHALCFQDLGEISIRAVKVKRRGFFYNLADSMCVWNAFHGFKGSWFVYIDAVPMCPVKSPEVVAKKVTNKHPEHHFNERAWISPCEPEKKLGLEGQGFHNSVVMRKDLGGRAEMLIDKRKDDGRKEDCKNLDETSNAIPAISIRKTMYGKRSKTSQQNNLLGRRSQHYLVENKRGKKVKEGLHEDYVEDCRGSKCSRTENIDHHLVDGRRENKKEFIADSSEGLTSKLPNNTIPLQNPSVEKHKKRKRKSFKSHEEAYLSMPSETLVPRSPQVTLDPHNSGKGADTNIYLEKYSDGPNVNLLLPNDRDIRMAPVSVSSFVVANHREKDRHSIETCIAVFSSVNIEPIEDQILQVNPEDQREKYVNLGQEINGDVTFKEPENIRISSEVPSELPFKSCCCTDKLVSRSSKILELEEPNNQQSREFDAAKCMTELNQREDEAGPVKERGIGPAEKFSHEERAIYGISENFSGDEHQCLDKETDAAASLKGASKDESLTQVGLKVLNKSRRSKKSSKTESSRACESTDINGDQEHFNSDGAQVYLNDVHYAANSIKHADQKADGGHCVDTTIKISSSTKEIPNQDQVSHLNSGHPPISMSHSLSEVSNLLVEQAPENRITSQPAFDVQATPCHIRKISKSELSKLGSTGVCDVVFVKSNEENVIGSDEGRGFDSSKLANGTNQKIERHCMDAKSTVSLSDENSSWLANMPQVNLLDSSSCKQQDLSEQSNAKMIIKEDDLTCLTSHGALAGSTKYKCNRKKSIKEVLKSRVSSEMGEHIECCGHGHAGINFSASPTDLVHSALQKREVIEGKQGRITEDGKEETPALPLDRGIDNMVSNDEYVRYKNLNPSTRSNPVSNAVGSNNFYASPNEGMTSQVASSDSTEDTPYHLRRFRVVRKIPIRRSNRSRTHNSNR